MQTLQEVCWTGLLVMEKPVQQLTQLAAWGHGNGSVFPLGQLIVSILLIVFVLIDAQLWFSDLVKFIHYFLNDVSGLVGNGNKRNGPYILMTHTDVNKKTLYLLR